MKINKFNFCKHIFVYIVFLILIVGCNNNYHLNLVLENAGGVKKGTTVTYKDLDVGKVTKIGLNRNEVLARLEISKDFFIPIESKFSVTSTDLLGNKAIMITFSENKNNYYSENDTIYAVPDNHPNIVDSTLNIINSAINEIKDTLLNNPNYLKKLQK
jgi:phospholipid/cholesterol/gamma-HCH transport system substrate-binding protein